MKNRLKGRRAFAALLFFGAAFLLYRAIMVVYGGAVYVNVWWVAALLFLEMGLDALCMFCAAVWFVKADKPSESITLKVTAAIIIVHAVRVLIFVIGRVGPWIDFDVTPEHRLAHSSRWVWTDVFLAGTPASLSVIALIVIWQTRKWQKSNLLDQDQAR